MIPREAAASAQGHAVTDAVEDDLPPITGDAFLDSMRMAAAEAAEVLRSIGSPYRLLILCLLMESEKTVTEICDAIGARQSLTSQHLTRLRLDGLVKAERRGHFAYYSLTDTVAKDIVGVLYQHYCARGMVPAKD
jgi:DNA-binding transcriptional ArsR family regulator